MDPILVSVNGAAQALNLGRTSIYALINEGRPDTVKLGRRTLIKVESIRSLRSGHLVPPPSPLRTVP